MFTMLLGAALSLGPAQPGADGDGLRLPFETGQLRIANGSRQGWRCTATGTGRGYERGAGACGGRQAASASSDASGDEPSIATLMVIGFTRAGERQPYSPQGRGRRLFDVEAEVALAPDGTLSSCRIVSTRGSPAGFFGRTDVCSALDDGTPLFVAATGSGLRQGRLRLTYFMVAPPAEIQRFLRPPPLMRVQTPVPPPIMMVPVAPPAPPAPPAPAPMAPPGSRPQPINRHLWISSDDYPASALRGEQEGTVTARLDVTPAGRVGNCTILSSSGSASLDSTTCRIFRSRARFRPARNARGEPVAGVVTERVRWVLPDEGTLPLEPAYAALSVSLEGDRRTACASIDEAPEDTALAYEGCGLILPAALPVPRAIGQGHSRIRVTLELTRDGVPRPTFARQSGNSIYSATAAFDVREDGTVTGCRAEVIVPPRTAAEPFDLCTRLPQSRPLFPERTVGSGTQAVRLVMTVREGDGAR